MISSFRMSTTATWTKELTLSTCAITFGASLAHAVAASGVPGVISDTTVLSPGRREISTRSSLTFEWSLPKLAISRTPSSLLAVNETRRSMMTWILASETCLMSAARLESRQESQLWSCGCPESPLPSRATSGQTPRPRQLASPSSRTPCHQRNPPGSPAPLQVDSRLDGQVLDLAVGVVHEREDLLDGRVLGRLVNAKLVPRALDVRDEVRKGHEPVGIAQTPPGGQQPTFARAVRCATSSPQVRIRVLELWLRYHEQHSVAGDAGEGGWEAREDRRVS